MIAPVATLEREEFHFIRDFVYKTAAIVIDEDKHYLVEYRLGPLIEREGIRSFRHLVSELRQPTSGPLRSRVVDAMTTNETSFFRDARPFDHLRRAVLPQLIERRRSEKCLTFFFGGCSSGQEPYSIAMILRQFFPELDTWNLRLTGADISSEMIRRAREGVYTQFEINRGLPARLLVQFFEKAGIHWRLSESIRSMVQFEERNLTHPLGLTGNVDIFFLRNVLIYFDQEERRRLLQQVRDGLRSDGFLMLGAAETTVFCNDLFVPVPMEFSNLFHLKGTPNPINLNPCQA
ncbi:MAG: protein-glutamate O-methyltransferase CheR [Methylacidiphilales bacterium]|nr:protein-glutamate O-methyltransferase CheR [Candidatus Methylacidiphilales bacterium]